MFTDRPRITKSDFIVRHEWKSFWLSCGTLDRRWPRSWHSLPWKLPYCCALRCRCSLCPCCFCVKYSTNRLNQYSLLDLSYWDGEQPNLLSLVSENIHVLCGVHYNLVLLCPIIFWKWVFTWWTLWCEIFWICDRHFTCSCFSLKTYLFSECFYMMCRSRTSYGSQAPSTRLWLLETLRREGCPHESLRKTFSGRGCDCLWKMNPSYLHASATKHSFHVQSGVLDSLPATNSWKFWGTYTQTWNWGMSFLSDQLDISVTWCLVMFTSSYSWGSFVCRNGKNVRQPWVPTEG